MQVAKRPFKGEEMTLAEIVKEIKEIKPFADEKLDGGPVETLNARRGRKLQSMERMRQLVTTYTRELGKSSLFIVVTGSARDEFTKLAAEVGIFTANSESIYKDLVSRISPELYMGKETMVNLFDVLGRCLEDKALELDIIGYPMLRYEEKYRVAVHNKEDFTKLIKRVINDQIGAEIAGISAIQTVAKEAMEKEHSAKTTSIILPTSDDTLAIELMRDLGRLSPRVFMIAAGKVPKSIKGFSGVVSVKEPTMDSVTAALKEIKSSLNK
jgi:hypothetical protein